MNRFDYVRATSIDEALKAGSMPGASYWQAAPTFWT